MLKKMVSIMFKQFLHNYISDDPKSFYVDNSANPKPIRTKFYTVTEAQVGHFPGNFGCLRLRVTKMTRKKYELFCQGYKVSKM